MRFATILERNRRFVQGRARKPLPPSAPLPLIVVACHDPRLDSLLRPALGLADDEALILRTPAARVAPDSSTLRNLCVAVHMFVAEEILVLGHTSCRMADFDTSGFIESFRKRGVPREAFGTEDIRTWVGAIPDPRRGVLASIAAIIASPCLPRGLPVGGLVLDDETGALEVVLKPGEAVPEGAAIAADATPVAGTRPPTGAAAKPTGAPRPAASTAAPPPRMTETDAGVPPRPPGKIAGGRPGPAHPVPDTARALVRMLASAQDWREDLLQLRTDLGRQRNPLLALALLEEFIGKAASQSHEVAEVYRRLKREVAGGGGRAGSGAVLETLRQAIEEEGANR